MVNELKRIKEAIGKLRFILNRQQKIYGVMIFFMSLIAALLETLGVSAILPLVEAAFSADTLAEKPYLRPFILVFHLENTVQIIVLLCVGISIVYLIKNGYAVLYSWASAKYAQKIRRELAIGMLEAYMKQGYDFFAENNTAKLSRGMGSDVGCVQTIIAQLFVFMAKILTIISISVFVIIQAPAMALFLLALVCCCFLMTQMIFRRPMKKYGELSRDYSCRAQQISLEALQGSKEVLVTGRQDYFVHEYLKSMIDYNKAELHLSLASAAPASIIEVVCVVGLIICIGAQIVSTNNSGILLTQLASVAVAAFRIFPALGIALSSVNTIVFNTPGLNAQFEMLQIVKKSEPDRKIQADCSKKYKNISLQNEIQLVHVSFGYSRSDEKVLNDLSMTIKRGSSVGFIGISGAGKTTLADIILALYRPLSGQILMDGINIVELGREWHRIVGYVPQNIYMTDSTIRKNIAFGIYEEDIDDDKIWKALEMAQMKNFVEELPDKINTNVGEWGVQLSGGQRQRIAIARALYMEPDVIILDEATAALDTETESAVMESIEMLKGVKTLIIVAHRLSTIAKCDEVYEISDGKAVRRNKEDVLSKGMKSVK